MKKGHRVPVETADEFGDFSHRRNVGCNIQRVGQQQQKHHSLEHDRRKRRLDVGREPLAGDPADLRTQRLDRGHQRVGQWHRPEHVEAELGPRLRVGRDAAGIVVGRSRDNARTDPCQRMFLDAAPKVRKRPRAGGFVVPLRRPHGASSASPGERHVCSRTGPATVHPLPWIQ